MEPPHLMSVNFADLLKSISVVPIAVAFAVSNNLVQNAQNLNSQSEADHVHQFEERVDVAVEQAVARQSILSVRKCSLDSRQ